MGEEVVVEVVDLAEEAEGFVALQTSRRCSASDETVCFAAAVA